MAVKGSAIRAVITGGAGKPPAPGDEAAAPGDALAPLSGPDADPGADEVFVDELKPGTRLFHGQYTIVDFLNSGGFGITYLARDSLERTVVIKECFPGTLCRRSNTIVRARSRAHQSDFRSVVRLFVQEARNLSKLVHPHIVGVHQVFEDNDTAYMAIDYVRGRDLLELLEDPSHRFVPVRVVAYVRKMLEAVRFVHESGVLHRDISPDNILIDENDEPVLIDFGAAREQASKQTRVLSALRVVKDGYSPQEFYIAGSVQNESSDLYALAATFYHVISGEAPPDSQRRLSGLAENGVDPYEPLAGRIEGYPPGFLEALDKAASVLPKDRLKSAEDWIAMLDEAAATAPVIDSARAAEIENAVAQLVAAPADPLPRSDARPLTAAERFPPLAEPLPQAAAAPARRRPVGGLALAGAVAAVAAIAGYLAVSGVPATGPADTSEATAPQPTLAAAPAPAAPAAEPAAAPATAAIRVAGFAPDGASAGAFAAVEANALVAAAPALPVLAAPPAAEVRAAFAAEASAAGAAEARRLAVAATGLTYDPPPVTAEASRDPSVLRDQRVSAAWTGLSLPFETRTVRIGGDDFPQVSAVASAAAADPANAWLRPGVTIYAVNNAWVSDEASIREQLAVAAAAAGDGPVVLELRVREALDRPFEVVSLVVPGIREATFRGGLAIRTEASDGQWRAVVADPGSLAPEAGDRALQAGDVILSEALTGRGIDGATAIEDIVATLAAMSHTEARLTVLRDGAEVPATAVLARGE
ncbi:MAG: protein kinase [Rhodobacteraceae bacterium]|jgi:serine/threonine protein kinase|nr:protein kinase [Paracoccaceae bacterium]